jgi:hypothetical protein
MNQTAGVSRAGNPVCFGSNRRSQPLGPSSFVPPIAARHASPAGGAVRFSGSLGQGLVNNILLPTFENIHENYLANFVATDVGGIWLARITTSLVTGRVPYDPRQDPEAQNLSMPHQVARYTLKNIQGLNWINFWEETKREIASGPGVLMASALTFLAARQMLRKGTIVLPFPVIQGLCGGFRQHLAARGGDIRQESHYRKALADYIASLFDDPEMRATRLDTVTDLRKLRKSLGILIDHPRPIGEADLRRLQENPTLRPLLESSPELGKQLRMLLGPPEAAAKARTAIAGQLEHRLLLQLARKSDTAGRLTYGDYLDRWSRAWVDALFRPEKDASSKAAAKARETALQTLEQDLRETLEAFNRSQRLRTSPESLHRTRTARIRYGPDVAKPESKELSQLTWELRQWGDFARNAWTRGKQTAATTDWPRLVERLQKQLVTQKYFFGTVATVLSCFHMAHLAFWAQNHKSYQATRLIRHKTPQPDSNPPPPPKPGFLSPFGGGGASAPLGVPSAGRDAAGFGPGPILFSNPAASPGPFSIDALPYHNGQRGPF